MLHSMDLVHAPKSSVSTFDDTVGTVATVLSSKTLDTFKWALLLERSISISPGQVAIALTAVVRG